MNNKNVSDLGNILCVWAHPDDESWYSIGLIKQALVNGQRVVLLTATKGENGKTADEERWPSGELSVIRQEEMLDCLDNLEGVEHRWLDYVDGELKEEDIELAAEKIAEVADEIAASTILTFESEGITGNDDHKAVHKWSRKASEKTNKQTRVLCAVESTEKYESAGHKLDVKYDIYFNCVEPVCIKKDDSDLCIELDPETLYCKLECLRAHQSQTDDIFQNEHDVALVKKMAECECFIFV